VKKIIFPQSLSLFISSKKVSKNQEKKLRQKGTCPKSHLSLEGTMVL